MKLPATLLHQVRDSISRQHLLQAQQSVLVAVSGGPDSVFLAHCLHELGYRIAIAHVNYQLRGEASHADEALAREVAAVLEVPFFVQVIDHQYFAHKKGRSLQAEARKLRYAFFEETMAAEGYTACATAHHIGDQAETLLLSLLKGSQSALMKGIPAKRGPYVRPLLGISKSDILEALAAAGIPWRQDQSNLGDSYQRNRVRNRLLPLLEQVHPGATRHLAGRAAWHGQQMAFIRQACENAGERAFVQEAHGLWVDSSAFVAAYGEAHVEIFLSWALEKQGLHGHELWQAVALYHADSGKYTDTRIGRITRRQRGLWIEPIAQVAEGEMAIHSLENQLLIFQGAEIRIEYVADQKPDFSIPNCYYLDPGSLRLPLKLRPWRQGDRMTALGMKQSQLLSDIFINEKYSPGEKLRAIVFEDGEGIVLLSGFRIAERVRVRSGSFVRICVTHL
ncbi:MAG: tRNA lysidine(34) synthetase TilS [Bacteroidetes bacterium]|nr:MAG: tRNA lysidine(34) synthetase TilS [Bacteroidota bacterium]